MQAKIGVVGANLNHGDGPIVDAFPAQHSFGVANIPYFELVAVRTD